MSESNGFEPKIIAYVCNWCTYLGADLAGTTRLEYPSNVRIVRLPCTGRIDFNLLIKAFEIGADAILVSGCHPGDCHYTAGNYHARRRWMLFRELLDVLGFDLRRIHFTWISAAEGRKFQATVAEITEQTRLLGRYLPYGGDGAAPTVAGAGSRGPGAGVVSPDGEEEMRRAARALLESGEVKVVIGHGDRGPVFVRRAEDVGRLVWNGGCAANLTTYLKRKEVRALGRPAVVVKERDARALVVLEKENQIASGEVVPIPVAWRAGGGDRYAALDAFMQRTPAERMAYWSREFDRCVKCYACRQSCPLCYCERCVADKNRPVTIRTSATREDNFAWHITRAFHLAGRCVGCGECTRACPAGIDLGLLNMALARAAEEHFGFRAGADPSAEPIIGSYAASDKEEFIR